nr:ribulose-phosphate 3-epimerase [bacterium]
GFGGQAFQASSLEKLRTAAALIAESGRDVDLGIDGGINPATAPLAVAAGARRLIAGSAVFGGNVEENVADLRAAAEGNRQ